MMMYNRRAESDLVKRILQKIKRIVSLEHTISLTHAAHAPAHHTRATTMRASPLLGFALYCLRASSAFQSRGAPPSPPRSASISHGTVPCGQGDAANDDRGATTIAPRREFLARALVATSSLPFLLGGIPSAFADDIAGEFVWHPLERFDVSPENDCPFSMKTLPPKNCRLPRHPQRTSILPPSRSSRFSQARLPESPSTPTDPADCHPCVRSA
jgi:hypothetical protein